MLAEKIREIKEEYFADESNYNGYAITDEDKLNGIIGGFVDCIDMVRESIYDYEQGRSEAESTLAEIKGLLSDINLAVYAVGRATEYNEERLDAEETI